ncbi:MAG TPA: aminopeptidase, partial [Polyangiaceae bacterium]|nr:aminopeptidase [Polyangiaceae bacterium]
MPLEHRLHDRCACGSSLSSARYAQGAPRPFVLSGTTRVYERSRPFTIRHIALDAVGFEIREVTLGTDPKNTRDLRPAEHTYDGEKLSVRVPEGASAAVLRVAYRAVPRRGLYFLAPDEHVQDRPRQVWSQ